MDATNKTVTVKRVNVRYLTVTAMLSAVAYILMFLDFSVPFMPAFIKMDLSELPALIGSFAMGPLCGVIVCLIKNVLHLFITTTGGVGELSNFILGVAFVLPAGLIYKHKKNRKSALIGSLTGAVFMGIFSVVSNYFLVYPVYYNFMPQDVILAAYQAVNPAVSGSLAESSAFVAGNTMLIVAKNRFFLTLLKSKENAVSLRETVKQFLGVEYNIRAKCSEPEQQASKAQNLVQKAMANHLDTAVENE